MSDPLDRRTIVLAPAGVALAIEAVTVARQINGATLPPLIGDESQQLLRLLRKLG